MNASLPRFVLGSGSLAIALAACSAESEPPQFRSIEPVCVEDEADINDDAWRCGESLTVECNTEPVPEELYVLLDPGGCGDVELAALEGPFGPGTYALEVVDEASGDALCTSELVVTDELPPEVTTTELELWPPNHKFHSIDLHSCFATVEDCDPDWEARLLWVASDEPANDIGDGNTSEDIVITSPTTVDLRSERQGGRNGRVYTLGWEVEDHAGNVTEGVCLVSVPHDRGAGGAAIDDGEAYRIEVE